MFPQRSNLFVFVFALAMVIVIFAGCSTPLAAPRAVCLPPAVPADVLTWPVVHVATMPIPVEGMQVGALAVVVYARGPRQVALGWVGGRPVWADPHNEDDRSLVYFVNGGELDANGHVLAVPSGRCEWRRAKGTQT